MYRITRILSSTIVALLVLMILQGCATKQLKKNAYAEMRMLGYGPNISGWAERPDKGGYEEIESYAREKYGFIYTLAEVFDYGVLPASGVALCVYLADKATGGDSGGGGDSFDIKSGGDTYVNKGDGSQSGPVDNSEKAEEEEEE